MINFAFSQLFRGSILLVFCYAGQFLFNDVILFRISTKHIIFILTAAQIILFLLFYEIKLFTVLRFYSLTIWCSVILGVQFLKSVAIVLRIVIVFHIFAYWNNAMLVSFDLFVDVICLKLSENFYNSLLHACSGH